MIAFFGFISDFGDSQPSYSNLGFGYDLDSSTGGFTAAGSSSGKPITQGVNGMRLGEGIVKLPIYTSFEKLLKGIEGFAGLINPGSLGLSNIVGKIPGSLGGTIPGMFAKKGGNSR